MITVEICVDDEAGAVAAIAGGADRIELCAALELGGLTPSPALLRRVVGRARPAGVEVHAMVRPRAGDFAYNAAEFALAIDQARDLLAAGASGLVFGVCRERVLDGALLARWRNTFPETPLTLHRAIDLVGDLPAAVVTAAELGFERILSSGGTATAIVGAKVLRQMVDAAQGRCRIAAGAGIHADNVAALIAHAGVDEVHGSASALQPDIDAAVVTLGFAPGPRRVTDRAAVAALCTAVRNAEPV